MMTGRAREIWVRGAGVDLHAVVVGPASGELVVLLHGFPETGATWRTHMGPLADAGFRVVAPDMRGYGRSDAPRGVDAYPLDRLVEDVIALADGLGAGRMVLVGHDWGGIVAWAVAARRPDRVARLVVLNAPHLDVFAPVARRHPSQILRSAYVGFFQLPGLSESVLRARGFALLRRAMTASARPGAFSAADLDGYAADWARPGRLTAMLNYYRALARRARPPLGRIRPPTLLLWGVEDVALCLPLAEASVERCERGALVSFPQATHWLHREEPEAVSRAILDHAA